MVRVAGKEGACRAGGRGGGGGGGGGSGIEGSRKIMGQYPVVMYD